MKAVQQNLNEWLRQEAHVKTGQPFQMGERACMPVVAATQQDQDAPLGFLVTHGDDVAYVAAHSPDGEQIMTAWIKLHSFEEREEEQALPAEYWYG